MKTFGDKINLLIFQKPWTNVVLSIVYILILRDGAEAYCYWDIPWEADIKQRENGELPPYVIKEVPISAEERFRMIEEYTKQKEELAQLIA